MKCNNFELQITPELIPPGNEDFTNHSTSLGLQYGADFELKYHRNSSRPYNIGILQFVKPSQIVGNQPGDPSKNIYIDKEKYVDKNGMGQTTNLEYYLFGNPGTKIQHNGRWFTPCTRAVNESTLHDIPREIIGYEFDSLSRTPSLVMAPKMVFYDFPVEINGDHCIIYPAGVSFTISVTQNMIQTTTSEGDKIYSYLNQYNIQVSPLTSVNFHDLGLQSILELKDPQGAYDYIHKSSYEIL